MIAAAATAIAPPPPAVSQDDEAELKALEEELKELEVCHHRAGSRCPEFQNFMAEKTQEIPPE